MKEGRNERRRIKCKEKGINEGEEPAMKEERQEEKKMEKERRSETK